MRPLLAAAIPRRPASFLLRPLSVRASGTTVPKLSFALAGTLSAAGLHPTCSAMAPLSETFFWRALGGLAPSCVTSGERSWTPALPFILWGLGIQVSWRRCLIILDPTPSSSLRVGGWQGVLSRRFGWLRILLSPRHRASTHCQTRPANRTRGEPPTLGRTIVTHCGPNTTANARSAHHHHSSSLDVVNGRRLSRHSIGPLSTPPGAQIIFWAARRSLAGRKMSECRGAGVWGPRESTFTTFSHTLTPHPLSPLWGPPLNPGSVFPYSILAQAFA